MRILALSSTNQNSRDAHKEVTGMKESERMAQEIKTKMAEGMSLEDALAEQLVKGAKGSKQMTLSERLVHIESLNDVSEVKRALKSAHGKKSKAKSAGTPQDSAEAEIKKANERLTELRAQYQDEDGNIIDFEKALELGEAAGRLLQAKVSGMEAFAEIEVKKVRDRFKVSAARAKKIIKELEPKSVVAEATVAEFPSSEMREQFHRRAGNDTRIISLLKKYNFLETQIEVLEEEAAEAKKLEDEAKALKEATKKATAVEGIAKAVDTKAVDTKPTPISK